MKRRQLLTAAAAAIVLVLHALGAFDRADQLLFDRLLRRRGELERTPRSVALVGVTDRCTAFFSFTLRDAVQGAALGSVGSSIIGDLVD